APLERRQQPARSHPRVEHVARPVARELEHGREPVAERPARRSGGVVGGVVTGGFGVEEHLGGGHERLARASSVCPYGSAAGVEASTRDSARRRTAPTARAARDWPGGIPHRSVVGARGVRPAAAAASEPTRFAYVIRSHRKPPRSSSALSVPRS